MGVRLFSYGLRPRELFELLSQRTPFLLPNIEYDRLWIMHNGLKLKIKKKTFQRVVDICLNLRNIYPI